MVSTHHLAQVDSGYRNNLTDELGGRGAGAVCWPISTPDPASHRD